MTNTSSDKDSDIHAQVKPSSKPRTPLKLGPERMSHEEEKGHGDSTALLRSQVKTQPYSDALWTWWPWPDLWAWVQLPDIMRSVCFSWVQQRLELCVWKQLCLNWFKMARWTNTNIIIKYNYKENLWEFLITHHLWQCVSHQALHKTCSNLIKAEWVRLSWQVWTNSFHGRCNKTIFALFSEDLIGLWIFCFGTRLSNKLDVDVLSDCVTIIDYFYYTEILLHH